MLSEEIGTSLLIDQLSWNGTETGTASYCDVEIHMGLCSDDFLGTSFESNYLPGTRTLVFQADSLTLEAESGEWFTVDLQIPFFFDCTENLLIEVFHNPGEGTISSWNWEAGPGRALFSWVPDATSGGLLSTVPYMMLSGSLSLDPGTFGSIKALFAEP